MSANFIEVISSKNLGYDLGENSIAVGIDGSFVTMTNSQRWYDDSGNFIMEFNYLGSQSKPIRFDSNSLVMRDEYGRNIVSASSDGTISQVSTGDAFFESIVYPVINENGYFATLDNQTITIYRITNFLVSPSSTSVSTIPSNAVVIPSDSSGPVQIILESSEDMVNWNSANPGTYGASTNERFFRVRAVEDTE